MAIAAMTFPRIEVRPGVAGRSEVKLFSSKDDDRSVNCLTDHVQHYIASFRADERAGNCCPVYNYTKDRNEEE